MVSSADRVSRRYSLPYSPSVLSGQGSLFARAGAGFDLAGQHLRSHISISIPTTNKRPVMSTFNDRERAFENKYAHDQEMVFKAVARRNKKLGLWAAGLLGKTGTDAEAYAMDVIRADFEEAGHEDVVRKLLADLAGLADEATIRAKMAELLTEAKAELSEG